MSSVSVPSQRFFKIARGCFTLVLLFCLWTVILHKYEKVSSTFGSDLLRTFKKVDLDKVSLRAAMTSLDTYRPDSFDILFKIADTPPKERMFALREHVDYYEKIIRYRPSQMDAYVLLGYCYYQEGRVKDALRAYEEAQRLDPSFFWSYYNLGAIYFNEKNYASAAQYFKRAVQLDARTTLEAVFRSRVYLEILSREKENPAFVQKSLTDSYKKVFEALVLCEYYLKKGEKGTPQSLPVRFF